MSAMRKIATTLGVLILLTAAGCTTTGGRTAHAGDGLLLVEAATTHAATVYAISHAGLRVRLGAVHSHGLHRFRVPHSVLSAQPSVRFGVLLAAGAGSWTSDPVPTDAARWQLYLEPTLMLSHVVPAPADGVAGG